MSSAGCVLSRTVVSTPEAVIEERACFRRLHPKILILLESSCDTGNVDVPLFDMFRFEKMGERIELSEILSVNHCRNGHADVFLLEVIDSRETLLEGSLPSERFVSFFHSVEADLNFMNPKFPRHVSANQHAIGEKYRSERVIFQPLVERPELRVE
jgi:hypothetical protein